MKMQLARAGATIGAVIAFGLIAACSPSGGGSSVGGTTTTINPNNGPDCNPPRFVPGANFGRECDLSNLTISGVDLSPNKTTPTYGPQSNLAGSTIIGSNLSHANLKYSNAPGASFLDSDLTFVVFVGDSETNRSNLTKTRWTAIDATSAELRYADLSGAEFNDVKLGGAVLAGSLWEGAILTNVTLDKDTICPDGVLYDAVDLCRKSLPGF